MHKVISKNKNKCELTFKNITKEIELMTIKQKLGQDHLKTHKKDESMKIRLRKRAKKIRQLKLYLQKKTGKSLD